MSRVGICILLAAVAQAQPVSHPRIWLSDARHGTTLLQMARTKAAAADPDWVALRGYADKNYGTATCNNSAAIYAPVYALMYQILVGGDPASGTARTAGDYASEAARLVQCSMDYAATNLCGAPGCLRNKSLPTDWTPSGAANIWYTSTANRYTQLLLHDGEPGANAYGIATNTNLDTTLGARLLAQWDHLFYSDTSSGTYRLYVYSLGNPATRASNVTISMAENVGNEYRNVAFAEALAFDWIYPALDAATIAAWVPRLRSSSLFYIHGSALYTGTAKGMVTSRGFGPGSNLRSGYWFSTLLTGLATWGNNQSDTATTNAEIAAWDGEWVNIRDHFNSGGLGYGGATQEGPEYGPQGVYYHMSAILARESAYGTTTLTTSMPTLLADQARWHMHSTSPTPTTAGLSATTPRYFPVQYGDQEDRSQYYFLERNRAAVLELAYLAGTSTDARRMRWWLSNRHPAFKEGSADAQWVLYNFLFRNVPEATEDDYTQTETALAHHSPGQDTVAFRSDWGPNATWGWFAAGYQKHEHQHADAGAFALFRKGKALILSEPGYSSPKPFVTSPEIKSALTHRRETDAVWKGTVAITADGPASIPRFASTSAYTYAQGILTNSFRWANGKFAACGGQSCGSWTNATDIAREFIHLNPDIVITYDRAAFAEGPAQVRWTVSSPAQAVIAGDQYTIVNDDQTAHITTVASTVPTTAVSYSTASLGSVYERSTPKATAAAKFYLLRAVTEAPASEHRLLHVIQATDAGNPAFPVLNLETDEEHSGVRINDPACTRMVIFSKGTAPTDAARAVAAWEGAGCILVTGLNAGLYDTAVGADAVLTNAAVGMSGTLYFEHTGGGDMAIRRVADLPGVLILETQLPDGTAGAIYSTALLAAGGTPPYTWSIVSGRLPEGLSLSGSGVITGRPTTAEEITTFTVQVSDSTGLTATKTFTLRVQEAAILDLGTTVNARSSFALLTTGKPGLAADVECVATAREAESGQIALAASAGGMTTRRIQLRNLLAGATYQVDVSCGGGTGAISFTTPGGAATGTRKMRVAATARQADLAAGVDTMRVRWRRNGEGDFQTINTPTPAAGRVEIEWNAEAEAIIEYSVEWLKSGQPVSTGPVELAIVR